MRDARDGSIVQEPCECDMPETSRAFLVVAVALLAACCLVFVYAVACVEGRPSPAMVLEERR